ncbi:MAG: hypothetical protein ACRDOU_16325 [Streptosporangiaceae bacterium]
MATGSESVRSRPADRATGTVGPAVAEPAHLAAGGRRPWWIWAVPFTLLFALLCARNGFLFTTRLYEQGDAGANSILITQAKHFTLLIGSYSREGFNHPGPAYMYVQALGEYLFLNALHVVPTAWNAHVLAVFVLDSAFLALAVGIVYGWTRSLAGAAATFAVLLGLAVVYPQVVNSDWMPYLYVPTYVVFLLAAGSVIAGRVSDLWILALSGWFLIHGHACFLLFVPVITLAVLVWSAAGHRRAIRASIRSFFAEQRKAWIPAAVISVIFAFPIVLNLALHWPGDFNKYISYGSSGGTSGLAGHYTAAQVTDYALWFWWPHANAWLAPVLLLAVAVGVIAGLPKITRGPLRRFLVALLALNVVSTLAFVLYTAVGIDDLFSRYIGYFYWSAPLVMVLIIVVGAVEALRQRSGRVLRAAAPAVAVLAAAAAFITLAVIPGTRTSEGDINESLPAAVAALAARSPGHTIALEVDHIVWPEAIGFLDQAERTGVRACLVDPWYTFIVTKQFICTPSQLASSVGYWFYPPAAPPGTQVILRFNGFSVARAW